VTRPQVDPGLAAAASSEEVRGALADKVSRERVGTEVAGMLEGPRPAVALALLSSLGLSSTVFRVPDGCAAPDGWGASGVACAEAAVATLRHLSAAQPWVVGLAAEERRVALLAAMLAPLRGMRQPGGKKKAGSAAAVVVRESLKLRGRDADDVDRLLAALPALARVAERLGDAGGGGGGGGGVGAEEGEPGVQEELGMAIRALGPSWRVAAALMPLLALAEGAAVGCEAPAGDGAEAAAAARAAVGGGVTSWAGAADRADAAARMAGAAGAVIGAAEAMGIARCHEWKPLVDGKELMRELGVKGPALGKVVDAAVRWQVRNPAGGRDEALAYLRGEWGGDAH